MGGDLRVNRLGFGAMRITGSGIWGDPPDRDQGDPLGGPEPMITAETVNGIMRFQANGLPVVSLYCRVDPGAPAGGACPGGQLLEMYQDEMRDVQTATDPVRKAGNTGESRPEDRIWSPEPGGRAGEAALPPGR